MVELRNFLENSFSMEGLDCNLAAGLAALARPMSVKPGAISTSTNCFATACAAAPSTMRLNAMMPPKADVGSVLSALL